ncbi:MAG TPA: hypothetical protein VLH09_14995, partial [Bryobacteraceae bacterium]|nr:hypothetical protein [Bryobacteraceae bacterium]
EPFEILGHGSHTLLLAIERSGKRWTRGDRFYHITGANDKAVAVEYLIKMYRRAFGSVRTVGIGDGPNDAKFLTAVDIPVIVRSQYAAALKRAVPNAQVTTAPGPHGWNEAVLPLATQAGLRGGRKDASKDESHQMA